MTQEQVLVDCLERLNRENISYMLTGSMASNVWGLPRLTHDLDFVLQLPPSEVHRFVAAFRGDYFIDEGAVLAGKIKPKTT